MKVLDKELNAITDIDSYESIVWYERYYGRGSFEFHVHQVVEEAAYIYQPEDGRLGRITSLSLTDDKVIYKGDLAEGLLFDKVVRKSKTYKGMTPEQIAHDLVKAYGPTGLLFEPIQGLGSELDAYQVQGGNLLEVLHELLRPQELGLRLMYDYESNLFTFGVYQGADMTDAGLTLSTDFESVLDFEYLADKEDYRNYAVVEGEVNEGSPRVSVIVDKRTDPTEEVRELYVDAKSVRRSVYDSGSKVDLSLSEYKAALAAYGEERLAKYIEEEGVDLVVNTEAVYVKLGEKWTYKNDYLTAQLRAEAVLTGYERGKTRQVVTFGSFTAVRRRKLL